MLSIQADRVDLSRVSTICRPVPKVAKHVRCAHKSALNSQPACPCQRKQCSPNGHPPLKHPRVQTRSSASFEREQSSFCFQLAYLEPLVCGPSRATIWVTNCFLHRSVRRPSWAPPRHARNRAGGDSRHRRVRAARLGQRRGGGRRRQLPRGRLRGAAPDLRPPAAAWRTGEPAGRGLQYSIAVAHACGIYLLRR